MKHPKPSGKNSRYVWIFWYFMLSIWILIFQSPPSDTRMAPPHQAKFAFRKDSTFSTEESKFIILKYGEVKNLTDLGTSSSLKTLEKFLTWELSNGSLTIFLKLPPSSSSCRENASDSWGCSSCEGFSWSKPKSPHQGHGGGGGDELWKCLDHSAEKTEAQGLQAPPDPGAH